MSRSKTVAVVTSRLRRLVRPDEPWLQAFRAVLRKISADQFSLVVGQQTAAAEFIQRGAASLNIPCDVVQPDAAVETTSPLHDRVLFESADVVYVLTLRFGGNIHSLIRDRLQQHRSVILVDLPGLQSKRAREEILELGASLWQPDSDWCRPFDEASRDLLCKLSIDSDSPYEIVASHEGGGWDMLTHTTRSCPGPWPDQSFENYADSLLESRSEADHSALGTLHRIVSQRRLLASATTIRDGHRVVSFTACPIDQLPSLHCFRTHRVRWDFEPFGICIRRPALIELGARPVIYRTSLDWESLSEADRPFFQLAKDDTVIDWSVEQEWRHVGDLDLAQFAITDVLLLVPNAEAAKRLSKISPWPISLWPA